ncbi:hypothetical protein MHP7448_0702 [Mesomycoplasma hyopneumoniae 7448]|uniref:Uncharacterized protein n=1 Tax=Mesomycoplasma hyopneumoniae (strain 7448) TaxID=262722 RepID=A4Q7W9_MESH7|nr:hypothetical protein MHP7448_0702 [Mesomycoplasma hyopneumoniae 7448]
MVFFSKFKYNIGWIFPKIGFDLDFINFNFIREGNKCPFWISLMTKAEKSWCIWIYLLAFFFWNYSINICLVIGDFFNIILGKKIKISKGKFKSSWIFKTTLIGFSWRTWTLRFLG